MSTVLTHGLADFTTGDFLDKFTGDFETEVSERRGTNGAFTKIKDFNPTNQFTIEGGGNPAIAVGVGTFAVTDMTGGVKFISKFSHVEKSNDFDDFTANGKHYPAGSLAT